ncbi:hypothetical protein [Azorhizobium sp. AG788]|uniref:hypothetical protein n=1 Tax=Azorhizobium sp. AG788 TaxID=2183897 RepID=UPI003139E110
MKSLFIACGLTLALVGGLANPSLAAEAKQDFTLVNKTGYEIEEVFVSPGKSGDWEEDVLGKGTLDDGESVNIRFKRASKTCIWDLKVVYSVDSSNAIWYDIDLCSVRKITIRYDKKRDKTTAVFD